MRVSNICFAVLLMSCSAGANGLPPAESKPATPAAEGAWERRLSDAELAARKKQLPPEVYHVTQSQGTEPPFHNAYWDNHAPGLYVDVVSGEPLFSSREKYDSGTGWPSFFAPLEPRNVVPSDPAGSLFMGVEVHSRVAASHLGHVFSDGPQPTHLRYCMDSASLRFVPAERLTAEGYAAYAKLFPNVKQQPAK